MNTNPRSEKRSSDEENIIGESIITLASISVTSSDELKITKKCVSINLKEIEEYF